MNKIISDAGGEKLDFIKYIDGIWDYAINNSDECVKTANKPSRKA